MTQQTIAKRALALRLAELAHRLEEHGWLSPADDIREAIKLINTIDQAPNPLTVQRSWWSAWKRSVGGM